MESQDMAEVKRLAQVARAQTCEVMKGSSGIIYHIRYPDSKFELMSTVGEYIGGLGDLKNMKNLTPENMEKLMKCMKTIIMRTVVTPKVAEETSETSLGYADIPGADKDRIFEATMERLNLTNKGIGNVETFRQDVPGKGNRSTGGGEPHIAKRDNKQS